VRPTQYGHQLPLGIAVESSAKPPLARRPALGDQTAPLERWPARGTPLWEAVDAEHDPAADPLLRPPAFEFDQRIAR